VPAAEIRLLREDVPANLATLCYKAVEKFVKAVENSCRTQQDQNTGEYFLVYITRLQYCYLFTLLLYFFWLNLPVLNCSRLLTRVLPYVFEEPDWENIFWSSLPAGKGDPPIPLAHSLCSAICVCNPIVKFPVLSDIYRFYFQDLLFCPDFTVASNRKNGPVSFSCLF